MSYALGVDLGTTYTAAAVRLNGHAEIARLGSRRAEIPSLVFVRPDGGVLIGEAAERRGVGEPFRLAREFKRRIGDPVPLLVGGSPYPAHALMARLLEEVLGTVTRQQEGPPAAVTVTYPANWGPYKRDLLGQAVRLADLHNVTLRAEPEAAAVRYATTERIRVGETVAVYDLGGGTFDAAVLRKTDSGFALLGEPEGIEQLGGIDFDEAVLAFVTATLGPSVAELDPDDPSVMEALARLRRDCIEAKEALSYDTEVMVPVALPNLHTRVRLNRSEFETMIMPAVLETIAALRRTMRGAGVEAADLRSILLAGGSSRIPLISQLLSVEFDRPVVLDPSPEHSIALGAALVTSGAAPSISPDSPSDPSPADSPDSPDSPDSVDEVSVPAMSRRGRVATMLSKLGGRSRPSPSDATPPAGPEFPAATPDAGTAIAGAAIAWDPTPSPGGDTPSTAWERTPLPSNERLGRTGPLPTAPPVLTAPASTVPATTSRPTATTSPPTAMTSQPPTTSPPTATTAGAPSAVGSTPATSVTDSDLVPDTPSRGVARVHPQPPTPSSGAPRIPPTGRATVPSNPVVSSQQVSGRATVPLRTDPNGPAAPAPPASGRASVARQPPSQRRDSGRLTPTGRAQVTPTSGAPVSGAPVSEAPVSGAPISEAPLSAAPGAAPVAGSPATPVSGAPTPGSASTSTPPVSGPPTPTPDEPDGTAPTRSGPASVARRPFSTEPPPPPPAPPLVEPAQPARIPQPPATPTAQPAQVPHPRTTPTAQPARIPQTPAAPAVQPAWIPQTPATPTVQPAWIPQTPATPTAQPVTPTPPAATPPISMPPAAASTPRSVYGAPPTADLRLGPPAQPTDKGATAPQPAANPGAAPPSASANPGAASPTAAGVAAQSSAYGASQAPTYNAAAYNAAPLATYNATPAATYNATQPAPYNAAAPAGYSTATPPVIPSDMPATHGAAGPAQGPSRPAPRTGRRAYRAVKIIVTLVVIIGLLAVAGAAYWFLIGDGKKDDRRPQSAPIAQWVRKADVPLQLEGAAVAAYQGKLWVAGGQQASDPKTKSNEVFVYDPATDDWTVGPSLPNQISHATLVPTPSGLYLVGGWLVDGGSVQVLRLDGKQQAWTPQPPLPESRVNGIGGFTGSEIVYAGGTRPGPSAADTVWALRRDAWVEIGRLSTPRQKAMAAGNGTDTLWIMGGRNIQTEEKFGTIDLIMATGTKPSDRTIDPPIDSGAGVYIPDSGICVVGGQTPNGGFNDWWCWEGGLARKLPALNPQRGGLAAAIIDRTVYVVGGYGKGFSSLSRLDTLTLPPR